jgi:sulfotransferase
MSGPVAGMFGALVKAMSGANEGALVISDAQRRRVMRDMVHSYYADEDHEERLIFDTSRSWCAALPVLAELFPASRIVCCVRSPAWILDSVERQVQGHSIRPSKIFSYETFNNVYGRVEILLNNGFVGNSLNNLRQAWFSEQAHRMIAVRYESLATNPHQVISRLYEELGEDGFTHDFENVDYSSPEFDEMLGLPGFHTVSPRVAYVKRQTILPPDLFAQYDKCFWDEPEQNPRGVTIL